MSIGKRFIDLARAELNSLLDYASRRGGDDDAGVGGEDRDAEGLAGFSRAELEEELARRRAAHAEVEEAIHGRRGPWDGASPPAGAGPRSSGPRGGRSRSTSTSAASPGGVSTGSSVERAYATLEVPVGSSFEEVRKSYRTLMRTYHPDRHTSSSPEKQQAANEVAQRLTEAYQILQKRLDR